MEGWKLVGLFSGLFLGGAPVLSASWTWFKKQIMGIGGSTLLGCGSLIIIVAMAAFGDWKLLKATSEGVHWSIELRKAKLEIKQLQDELRIVSAAVSLRDPEKFEKIWTAYSELPKLKSAVLEMGSAQVEFLDWGIKSVPYGAKKKKELQLLKGKTFDAVQELAREKP